MPRIDVQPELLEWARTRADLTVDDLLRRFPKLEQWETGEIRPTLRQLEHYARATHVPFGYLMLQEPPEEQLPLPVYRTVTTLGVQRPSPGLFETVQTIERRQAWMREHLVEDDEQPLAFVGSANLDTPATEVANSIRLELGLASGWAKQLKTWTDALRTFREAAEGAGIVVASSGIVGNNTHHKLDPTEFRGFVLVDPIVPFVFLNAADAKGAQMFTLAHELAHVWFGVSAVFDLAGLQPADNKIEAACNAVAAELLVPAEELKTEWNDAKEAAEPFNALARHFKVSAIVAARRALDLHLISKTAFFEFYDDYIAQDHGQKTSKKQDGGNFYATQSVRLGRRFAETVIRAAREGRLLYRTAYELTGLWGTTFDKYAAAVEGSATA